MRLPQHSADVVEEHLPFQSTRSETVPPRICPPIRQCLKLFVRSIGTLEFVPTFASARPMLTFRSPGEFRLSRWAPAAMAEVLTLWLSGTTTRIVNSACEGHCSSHSRSQNGPLNSSVILVDSAHACHFPPACRVVRVDFVVLQTGFNRIPRRSGHSQIHECESRGAP